MHIFVCIPIRMNGFQINKAEILNSKKSLNIIFVETYRLNSPASDGSAATRLSASIWCVCNRMKIIDFINQLISP